MMKFFTDNRMLAVLLLPLIVAGYTALNIQFSYFTITADVDFGLFGVYQVENTLYKSIAGALIVLVNAYLINFVFNHFNLHDKDTGLPGFIYTVWMSFFSGMYNPDGYLLAHTAIILMLFQLFRLNQNEDGRKIVYNAGLLAGIATSLHVTSVVVVPFVFFMVWTARPFVLRETILILAGIATPLCYAGVVMLLQNDTLPTDTRFNTTLSDMFESASLSVIVIAGLFTLLSFIGLQVKLKNTSIRLRKISRILWLFFFMTLTGGIMDLLIQNDWEFFSMVFVVLSMLYFYTFLKKPVSHFGNALFLGIMIASIAKFFIR